MDTDLQGASVVTIRNKPNNTFTRFGCCLCGGCIEKQDYLFELPDGGIVCNQCAREPEKIPERIKAKITRVAAVLGTLKVDAGRQYVTEVVPVPDKLRPTPEDEYGYSEECWPNWMRKRLGLSLHRIVALRVVSGLRQDGVVYESGRWYMKGNQISGDEVRARIKARIENNPYDEYPSDDAAISEIVDELMKPLENHPDWAW